MNDVNAAAASIIIDNAYKALEGLQDLDRDGYVLGWLDYGVAVSFREADLPQIGSILFATTFKTRDEADRPLPIYNAKGERAAIIEKATLIDRATENQRNLIDMMSTLPAPKGWDVV